MKFQGQPVIKVIGDRFWPTILLIGLAEVIAIIVGLALGAYTGWRRGGMTDRIGNGLSLVLYSMPYFVIGMPMIIIFAAGLGWFPTSGMLTAGATYAGPLDFLGDLLSHLALPLATISLGLIGGYSILMRSSITETRAEDYIATARAKGLPDGKILRSHAIPNALLPAVTLIAINLGAGQFAALFERLTQRIGLLVVHPHHLGIQRLHAIASARADHDDGIADDGAIEVEHLDLLADEHVELPVKGGAGGAHLHQEVERLGQRGAIDHQAEGAAGRPPAPATPRLPPAPPGVSQPGAPE
jgi:hypothetical protein